MKKTLSMLLALVMLFSLFPASAFAENDIGEQQVAELVEEPVAEPTEEPTEEPAEEPAEEPLMELTTPAGTPLTQESFTDGIIIISTDVSYYLSSDITGDINVLADKTVSIDLNGFVLKGTGNNNRVIYNAGTLTIKDSGATAVHNFKVGADGLWTLTTEAATVNYEDLTACPAAGTVVAVKGGVITGGKIDIGGGGIYNSGKLTMNGGNIIGNFSNTKTTGGGGLYNNGTATLTNTYVLGNASTVSGGGILNYNGIFTATDSVICYNKSASYGGGVSNNGNSTNINVNGTGTLENCTITGNSANYGGGIHNGYKTILKGTTVITGNTASSIGGGISGYGYWGYEHKGQITVDGTGVVVKDNTCTANAELNNLALELGYTLKIENAAGVTGNNIHIGLFNGGYVSGAAMPAAGNPVAITDDSGANNYSDYFTCDNAAYSLVHKDNKEQLSISAASITKGGITTYYDTVMDAVNASVPADKDTVKLLRNVTENVTIYNNDELTLDLNGFVLKGTGTTATIINNGTLTVKDTNGANKTHYYTVDANGLWKWDDSSTTNAVAFESLTARPASGSVIAVKGGAITGGSSINRGGGIYSAKALKLVSGSVIGNTVNTNTSDSTSGLGGGVYAWLGTFELSGGCICGNTSSKMGGGVYFGTDTYSSGCSFTMSGGSIVFNTTKLYGSAISSNTVGSAEILGGKIAYNHLTNPGTQYGGVGGAVEVWSSKNLFTLGGELVITDNTAGSSYKTENLLLSSGVTVSVSDVKPLTGSSKIGVTLKDKTGAVTKSYNTDYSAYFESDNTAYSAYNKVTGSNMQVMIGSLTAMIVESGVVYDTVQLAVSAANKGETVKMLKNSTENVTVDSDDELTLDLNGKTLTGISSTTGQKYAITNAGKLTIKDSGTGGTITRDKTGDGDKCGGVKNTGTLNLEGGTISGCLETSSYGGGGVLNLGTFNMSAGTITGCKANVAGSGVLNSGSSAVFNLSGGTITECDGKSAVWNDTGATFYMTAGTISDSDSQAAGGVRNKGTFNMSGGTIKNCQATASYMVGVGGVYNESNGTFNMSGTASITGCISASSSGGVYNDNIFTMTGGSITGNIAADSKIGGGVRNESTNSVMTVGGTAVITDNKVGSAVNNVYISNGKFITVDASTPLTTGACIGVTLASSTGQFTSNGAITDEAYFFSDNTAYKDKYNSSNSGYLELVAAYVVTEKSCENGSVSVGSDKSFYEGETVIVTPKADEGYFVSKVFYQPDGDANPTEITAKDGVYSFTMPAKVVTVSATYKQNIIVTSNANSGEGTLRWALEQEGDRIAFDKSLSGETITLESDLVISKSVTIDASMLDNGIVIAGNRFKIKAGDKSVNIIGLTFKVVSSQYTAFYVGQSKAVTITDCEFKGCALSATSATSAIYIEYGALTMVNCLVAGNTTQAGVHLATTSTLTMTNCTIANNSYKTSSNGIFAGDGSTVNIYNCIVAGHKNDMYLMSSTAKAYNTLSAFTNWTNSAETDTGNLVYDSSKPLFVDAANGDFHLAKSSQAKDVGKNSFFTGAKDIDGYKRVMYKTIDMGAYEYQYTMEGYSGTYDGQDHDALTIATLETDASASYSIGGESKNAVPSVKKAGTHSVQVTVKRNGYKDYVKTVAATIAKADPAESDFSYTAPSNLTFSNTAKTAAVVAASGVDGMGTVTVGYYSDADCTKSATPTATGDYYVGISVAEGDNYNAAALLKNASWKFTITPAAASVTVGSTTTYYDTIANAWSAAQTAGTAKVTLLADAEANLVNANGKTITLDLNDFVLKGDGTSSVITNNGTLTIEDKAATKTDRYFTDSNSDGCFEKLEASYDTAEKTEGTDYIKVKGGVITGGTGTELSTVANVLSQPGKYGGGILNYGTLTVTGGNFIGNSCKYGGGGMANVDSSATANISGCGFYGNAASTQGGAVYNTVGTITADKVVFSYNSSDSGGAIYNDYKAAFTATNTTISANTATFGGGVYNKTNCTFTAVNTTISDNVAKSFAGGIHNAGAVTVGGTTKIIGNTKTTGNAADNLRLSSSAPLTIADIKGTNNAMEIGVYLSSQIGIKYHGAFTTNGTADDAKFFTSDSLAYKVKFVEEVGTSGQADYKAAHLELVNFDINDITADTGDLKLENKAMSTAQAKAIAEAQKSYKSLSKTTLIAYAEADDFATSGKYKVITAGSGIAWDSAADMTIAQLSAALASNGVFVIGEIVKFPYMIGTAGYNTLSDAVKASKNADTIVCFTDKGIVEIGVIKTSFNIWDLYTVKTAPSDYVLSGADLATIYGDTASNTVTFNATTDVAVDLKGFTGDFSAKTLALEATGSAAITLTDSGETKVNFPAKVSSASETAEIESELFEASITTGTVTTYYFTLAAAVAAAVEDDTVILLKDVGLSSALCIDKSITLDLNTKTLDTNEKQFYVGNDVEVTVKNGTIDGSVQNGNLTSYIIFGTKSTGTLNLVDLVFTDNVASVISNIGTKLTITGCTIPQSVTTKCGELVIDMAGKTINVVNVEGGTASLTKAGTINQLDATKGVYVTKDGVITITKIGDEWYWDGYVLTLKSYVAKIVRERNVYYDTIQAAFDDAEDGETVILMQEKNKLSSTLVYNKTAEITVDMNGSEITAADCRALWIKAGGIEFAGSGAIKSTHTEGNTAFAETSSVIRVGADESLSPADAQAKLTIGEDISVTTDYCYCITAFGGYTYENVMIRGTVSQTGTMPALGGSGNDTETGATFNVIGTAAKKAKVSSDGSVAIFCPQVDTTNCLNVNYAEINGVTGIELRAGSASISNSDITATGTYKVTANGSGTTTEGAAIAIAQHTTKMPVILTMTGDNTVDGGNKGVAVSIANPEENESTDVKVYLNGGTFTGGLAIEEDYGYTVKKKADVTVDIPTAFYWKDKKVLTARTTPDTPDETSYSIVPETLVITFDDTVYELALKPESGDPVYNIASGTTLQPDTKYLIRVKETEPAFASEPFEFATKITVDLSVTNTDLDFDWTGSALDPDVFVEKAMVNTTDVTENITGYTYEWYTSNAVIGDDEALESAPVDAGAYKVVISIVGTDPLYKGSVTVEFSILPVEINAENEVITPTDKSYDKSLNGDEIFRVSASEFDFLKLEVSDGTDTEELKKTQDYTAAADDAVTEITILETYLDKLPAGTYTFKATFGLHNTYADLTYGKTAEVEYKLTIGECIYTEQICIQEGSNLTIKFCDKQLDNVELIKSGNGWVIKQGEKYVGFDANTKTAVLTDSAAVWYYNGSFYMPVSSVVRVMFFWSKTTTVNYYLTLNTDGEIAVCTCANCAVIYCNVTTTVHEYEYTYLDNEQHELKCTKCGAIAVECEDCTYDETTHLCRKCCHRDPSALQISAKVCVVKTFNTNKLIRFLFGYYSYNAVISTECVGDTIASVQYSVDGENYCMGTCYSSYFPINTLYVKVTTTGGNEQIFKYEDCKTTALELK